MSGKKLKQVILPLTLVLFAACNKQVLVDYEKIPSDPISVNLVPGQPGIRVPSDFTGLSFETDMLTEGYLNGNNTALIRLVKLLGAQGSIRVGGTSLDNIFWTDKSRNGSTDVDSLYTTDVANFFAFARATGWKVLFGLNMAQSTSAKAVSEADYILGADASSLTAFELGDAPDQYATLGLRPSPYTYAEFLQEWQTFYSDVHPLVPKAVFAGPSTNDDLNWLLPFISAEAGRISMATNHFYMLNGSDITATRLLTPDDTFLTSITETVASCRVAGLPFRMEETNSVAGTGKGGVSNTLASALWGLDYMFALAGAGVNGVNFHGNNTDDNAPISITGTTVTAEPLFYGMLCFQLGCQGRFIPVRMTTSGLNITAYAVLTDNGKIALTVINKDGTTNADLTIDTGMPLTSAGYISLASSTSTLTATSGITLGGNAVKSNGDFTTPAYTPITQLSGDTAFITVPAASAMVISLQ